MPVVYWGIHTNWSLSNFSTYPGIIIETTVSYHMIVSSTLKLSNGWSKAQKYHGWTFAIINTLLSKSRTTSAVSDLRSISWEASDYADRTNFGTSICTNPVGIRPFARKVYSLNICNHHLLLNCWNCPRIYVYGP